MGNYYNWNTAIASNNSSSLTSGNAPNSICPANWRLPRASGDYPEFATLFVHYNVIPDINSSSYVIGDNNASIGFNNIRSLPLYLARSGNLNGGSVSNKLSVGNYWYNMIKSGESNYVKFMEFGNGNVLASNANQRLNGKSIRCLAR